MNQPSEVLASSACVVAAAVLAIGARLTWHPTQPTVQPRALPDPAVWRACHAPACGHLETRHDPSPLGLVCRDCTERTEAS